jgi:hypothetical protein
MEEKSREIAETTQGYHLAHGRSILPLVVSLLLVCATVVCFSYGWERYGARRDPLIGLTMLAAFFGVLFTLACVERGFCRRWRAGDPRVQPELVVFSPRAVKWQRGLFLALCGTASWFARGFSSLGGPRFGSLGFAVALVLYILAVDYAVYRADGVRLWRLRFPYQAAIGLTLLYGVAVAVGLPQPYGDLPGLLGYALRMCWCLVIFAISLVMTAPPYSRRQFRRLQRLVNEDPPQEERGDD